MIKKTVNTLSDYIAKEANIDQNKKDKIRFGLEIIVSSLISLITILILSVLLGLTNIVIYVMIASAILKLIAGGIHFKTISECALISALFYNIAGFIGKYMQPLFLNYINFILLIITVYILGILYFWSPAPVENKSPKQPEQKKKLKIFSIIVATIILILSYILLNYNHINIGLGLVMGLVLHAFTITPLAYYLHDKYYFLKKLITK